MAGKDGPWSIRHLGNRLWNTIYRAVPGDNAFFCGRSTEVSQNHGKVKLAVRSVYHCSYFFDSEIRPIGGLKNLLRDGGVPGGDYVESGGDNDVHYSCHSNNGIRLTGPLRAEGHAAKSTGCSFEHQGLAWHNDLPPEKVSKGPTGPRPQRRRLRRGSKAHREQASEETGQSEGQARQTRQVIVTIECLHKQANAVASGAGSAARGLIQPHVIAVCGWP